MKKNKTVLVIEDNLILLENTSELLEMWGYIPLTADNGTEGIEIATQKQPDLILCDIVIGTPDGFEVIIAIKNNSLTTHIPFVFFSAQTEKATLHRAKSLGADGFIFKPFTIDDLLKNVQEFIKLKKTNK